MKKFKVLSALALVVLFSSCGAHYSNEIISRSTAQTCNFLPINDSVAALDAAGLIRITYIKNSNPEICDSTYSVEKTWWQAWQAGKKDGSVVVFFVGILGLLVSLYCLWRAFENNTRDSNSKAPLGWLVPVFACAIITGIALNWDKWNSGRDILKKDYIQYIKADGDLRNFWPTPVKSY
jgi:hypothetical protein